MSIWGLPAKAVVTYWEASHSCFNQFCNTWYHVLYALLTILIPVGERSKFEIISERGFNKRHLGEKCVYWIETVQFDAVLGAMLCALGKTLAWGLLYSVHTQPLPITFAVLDLALAQIIAKYVLMH